jgi:GT2 family glycosyltransferase
MNKDGNITAIITVWKRNHLAEQLRALLSQTRPPSIIWVQQTQHHVNVDDSIHAFHDRIQYTCQEENKGVFGRFESVRQVETEFTYIIDDDIIPGTTFLDKALNTRPDFYPQRAEIVASFRKKAWKLQKETNPFPQIMYKPTDISVIMSVQNYGNNTHNAIQSILSQTFRSFEFLIIHDAPADNAVNAIKQYKDSRIHWVNTKQQTGLFTALNIGCGLSNGKYVCIMDANCTCVSYY